MEEQSQIELDDNDESFPCTQTLWVTQLGPNRFRLEQTPFPSNLDAWLHDIIEATQKEDGTYLYRGLVEKSKWKMHDFEMMRTYPESAFMATLITAVEELGGICEDVSGCFIAYVPSGCEFDPRKEADRIAETLNLPSPWVS